MCGRFATTHTPEQLAEEFEAVDRTDGPAEPDYNVAPTKPIPAVLTRMEDGAPVRQLRSLRWGLVPSWAKDPSIGSRMINARIETAATKPAFRAAFSARRCLIPADGFYEWEVIEGEKRKQPWFIHAADGGVMAFAGLYERWKDAEGRVLRTCTIITTEATDDIGKIHDRSPMVVERSGWAHWLDPTLRGTNELSALLSAAVPGPFAAHKVSTDVGKVQNNSPELLLPVS